MLAFPEQLFSDNTTSLNYYIIYFTVVACVLATVSYGYMRYRIISKDLKRYNLQFKTILEKQPNLWASWWHSHSQLLCSNEFRKKIGVDVSAKISPKYIKYLFGQFSFTDFFKVVHQGNVFKSEYVTSEGEIYLVLGSVSYLGDDACYTIWCTDISHHKSKIEIHNEIINTLRTERDIMKDMLDNLPWPAWYKNHQKQLLFCNKAYSDALDVTPDQAVVDQIMLKSWQQGGRTPNLTDLVLRTKLKQTQQCHMVIKNERQLVEFTEGITSKGFILGYLKNLSDQEKLQEEIKHLAHSTREILELISLPVIIYNRNQQVEFFNNPFIKMFELDPAWLETKPTFTEVLEELRAKRKLPDTEDFQSYRNRRLACFNNLLAPIEDIAYYPDGRTVRMVTAPYHDGGLMITLNDITDWLTLERQYNTLLAVHRQVADNLFEGLAVFGSDHKLQLYNSAFCRMWHYKEDDLVPPPHLEAVVEKIKTHIDYQHYETSWENFKKRIKAKIIDRSKSKEGRIKLYDDVVYDYSYTPLPDGSNLLTFLDVSDRVRIETSLLERSEALELEHGIKSDFISIIHQEIRHPLRRILISFSDLIEQKHGELSPKYHEQLKEVWQEVDHVLRLMEDANDLASIGSGNTALTRTSVNIMVLIKDVMATLIEHSKGKNVNFDLMTNIDENFWIDADPKRLKQAFFSLLRHAIGYAEPDELISIHMHKEGGELTIDIINSASSIPYEDSYGASKKLKRGEKIITGLGFSLIKKIITLHGGRVIIDNQKGTKVSCILKV